MSHVCLACKENPKAPEMKGINDEATLRALVPRYREAVEKAALLFCLVENKGINYSSVFNLLLGPLDEAARGMLMRRLRPAMPSNLRDRERWLGPSLSRVEAGTKTRYLEIPQNLKRTLVSNRVIMPIGLLRSCIYYAINDDTKIDGVFRTVRNQFNVIGGRELLSTVERIYEFRNTRVAHQEKEVTDPTEAQQHLVLWIKGLKALTLTGPLQ